MGLLAFLWPPEQHRDRIDPRLVLVAPFLLPVPCRPVGVIREMGWWSQPALSLKISKFRPC